MAKPIGKFGGEFPELPQSSSGKKKFIRIQYFFYFAAFGILVNFLNIHYYNNGLSGVQIGALSSVAPFVSIAAAPLWGIAGDWFGSAKAVLAICCSGIILSILGISLVESFSWLVLLTLSFAFFDSSILPIMDSTTLRILGDDRASYGRERMWGTLGYIIAVWVIGFFLNKYGSQWLFPIYITLIATVVVTLRWLPKQKAKIHQPLKKNILSLVSKKDFLVFSVSILMMGLGSVAVTSFLGMYIQDLGGNEILVGTAAALAAVTEVPIFFFGSAILKRFGIRRALLVAFSANSLRLFLYGMMPVAWWVIPISLLHSLTFGVYWIASVAYMDSMASDRIKSSAQGIFYAVLNISRLVGSLAAGVLFDRLGGGWLFLVSTFFSLISILMFWLNKPDQKIEGASG